MSKENRPDTPHSECPLPIDEWEMSFVGNLSGAVDNLFSSRPVAEKLSGLEENEQVREYIRQWKQAINQHLEQSAWAAVATFLSGLDGGHDQTTPVELEPPSFAVANIGREDLQGIISMTDLAGLSDRDLARIADKMGDAYRDSGAYWEHLETIAPMVVNQKKADQ